jgi:hypothetical protein
MVGRYQKDLYPLSYNNLRAFLGVFCVMRVKRIILGKRYKLKEVRIKDKSKISETL